MITLELMQLHAGEVFEALLRAERAHPASQTLKLVHARLDAMLNAASQATGYSVAEILPNGGAKPP